MSYSGLYSGWDGEAFAPDSEVSPPAAVAYVVPEVEAMLGLLIWLSDMVFYSDWLPPDGAITGAA